MSRKGEDGSRSSAVKMMSNANKVKRFTPEDVNEEIRETSNLDEEFDTKHEFSEYKLNREISMRQTKCSETVCTTNKSEKFENGERIQMTINTFKQILYQKNNDISPSSLVDNTPVDNDHQRLADCISS